MRLAITTASLALAVLAHGCATSGDAPRADAADASADAAPADAASDVGADAALEADADAASPSSVALHATSGWQIYPGGGYHYGPSIIVDGATIHMWTCSPGANGAWDYVRYHASTDGGRTWSADVVALSPTPGTLDAYSTCDPGAVKIGSYFYVGYTSTTNSAGTQNDLFVARSTSPTGPFDKWNGSGWGGSPQPIVRYTGDPTKYGIGEPSLVLMGKRLFVYYTNDDGAAHTDLSTVDDASVDDWPAHLASHGHAIARAHPAEDSTDIKYVDALSRFVGVATYDRFSPNATVAVYQSTDGLTFEPASWLGARVQIGAHNIGISGDASGHIDTSASLFVAYAYQPAGSAWGNWPTFLDRIAIATSPLGGVTGGAVSSIVGGNDWNWSGPRARDGDPATVFSSDSHGATDVATEWAMVELGRAFPIAGVSIWPRAMGLGFPIDFAIQTSADGATWTTVPGQAYNAYPNPGSAALRLAFGAPVAARYLRVYATRLGVDDNATHYLQLAEITPWIAP